MIIGTGDIASVLPDRDDLLFFASGVSDSSCTDLNEFSREKRLLLSQPNNKRLVYFSSLSIHYKDSMYTKHKKEVEHLVKLAFPDYCIIRLGNIDWGTNPNTIINYFKNNPTAEIRDEFRYIINKEDFLHWIDLIPNFNTEMNLTGQRMSIQQIYNTYANE